MNPGTRWVLLMHVQSKDEHHHHLTQLSAAVDIASCQDALRLASLHYDTATGTLEAAT
jgi:hypothetical protein